MTQATPNPSTNNAPEARPIGKPASAQPGLFQRWTTVHKYGQGYWVRMLTACGTGTVAVAFGVWLGGEFAKLNPKWGLQIQAGTIAGVVLITAILVWRILNRPKTVDFMIATESEMRKVNWPAKREVVGSTWVVISGTIMMAVFLMIADFLFEEIFSRINILQIEPPLKGLWNKLF